MSLKILKLVVAICLSLGSALYASALNNNISLYSLVGIVITLMLATILTGSFLSDLYIETRKSSKKKHL